MLAAQPLPLATALALGLVHALEPDHMAAVTTFVARRPGATRAAGFGLRWGAGHAAAVLAAGGLLVALGARVPEGWTRIVEGAVGATLVALGVWAVRSARRLHAHEHEHGDGTRHTHLHSHLGGRGHDHGHALTLIGALHGLAGTAPAVALVPVTLADSPLAAGGYLLLFGAGTVLGMVLYALVAGWVYGGAARRSEGAARALAALTGLGSLLVGLWWIRTAAG